MPTPASLAPTVVSVSPAAAPPSRDFSNGAPGRESSFEVVAPARFTFLDQPGPIAVAHQGGAKENPANTMVAFEHAIALGYRYLDADVRVTADGVLVVFHDATLDDGTDRSGRIARLPWEEVRRARVAGREPIPRLDDLLAAWPEARVNLEVKGRTPVEAVAELIERTGSLERVCLNSFLDRPVQRLRRRLGPRLCTSFGTLSLAWFRVASLGLIPRRVVVGCAQIPVRLGPIRVADRRFLDAAHGLGLKVLAWTIDDENEMERLLDLGVDGILSDRPSALKRVLERRGGWTPT